MMLNTRQYVLKQFKSHDHVGHAREEVVLDLVQTKENNDNMHKVRFSFARSKIDGFVTNISVC